MSVKLADKTRDLILFFRYIGNPGPAISTKCFFFCFFFINEDWHFEKFKLAFKMASF